MLMHSDTGVVKVMPIFTAVTEAATEVWRHLPGGRHRTQAQHDNYAVPVSRRQVPARHRILRLHSTSSRIKVFRRRVSRAFRTSGRCRGTLSDNYG